MADETETATPSYTLFNISAGTKITIKGKTLIEININADNIFNRAYQNHLSRLKYAADINTLTGRKGVFNIGRNIRFSILIPLQF